MKTNKRILSILALAASLLLACNPLNEELSPDAADYKGVVSVFYEGEWFNNENISVNINPSEDGKTASVKIFKIRFVPKMPVRIDVTIPDIQLDATADGTRLSCDNVIPRALGGDYPKYRVTELTGTLSGDILEFSLNFGEYPTTFKGVRQ